VAGHGPVTSVDIDPAGWILKSKSGSPWELFLVTCRGPAVRRRALAATWYCGLSGRFGQRPVASLPRAVCRRIVINAKGVISGRPHRRYIQFMVRVKDNLIVRGATRQILNNDHPLPASGRRESPR